MDSMSYYATPLPESPEARSRVFAFGLHLRTAFLGFGLSIVGAGLILSGTAEIGTAMFLLVGGALVALMTGRRARTLLQEMDNSEGPRSVAAQSPPLWRSVRWSARTEEVA